MTFPAQLSELLEFLNKDFPPDHRFRKIRVSPDMPGAPDVWLLGSSLWSAEAAAQFGLPYNFAHFIDPNKTREAIETYRVDLPAGRIWRVPSRDARDGRDLRGNRSRSGATRN